MRTPVMKLQWRHYTELPQTRPFLFPIGVPMKSRRNTTTTFFFHRSLHALFAIFAICHTISIGFYIVFAEYLSHFSFQPFVKLGYLRSTPIWL